MVNMHILMARNITDTLAAKNIGVNTCLEMDEINERNAFGTSNFLTSVVWEEDKINAIKRAEYGIGNVKASSSGFPEPNFYPLRIQIPKLVMNNLSLYTSNHSFCKLL